MRGLQCSTHNIICFFATNGDLFCETLPKIVRNTLCSLINWSKNSKPAFMNDFEAFRIVKFLIYFSGSATGSNAVNIRFALPMAYINSKTLNHRTQDIFNFLFYEILVIRVFIQQKTHKNTSNYMRSCGYGYSFGKNTVKDKYECLFVHLVALFELKNSSSIHFFFLKITPENTTFVLVKSKLLKITIEGIKYRLQHFKQIIEDMNCKK